MYKLSKTLWFPVVAAVLLALSFVLMGVWVRMMADSFGTWQQVYLRIFLAGLLAVVVFRRSFGFNFWRQVRSKDWAIFGLRGFLAYTVGVGFFTIAIQQTQLSIVSFVASLPILGLLAWIMFGEKIKVGTLPFIGLSVVGLVLITGLSLQDLRLGWGEMAAIIGMLGFDLGYLMTRYHPKSFSNYQNTTLMLLVSWVPVFIISMWLHEPIVPSHVSAEAWIGLLVSSIMNVVALILINYVFSHMKAYVAGNILLLEGVFAVIIGYAFYGEIPTVIAIVGAGLILCSAYAISFIDARSDRLEAAQLDLGGGVKKEKQ